MLLGFNTLPIAVCDILVVGRIKESNAQTDRVDSIRLVPGILGYNELYIDILAFPTGFCLSTS